MYDSIRKMFLRCQSFEFESWESLVSSIDVSPLHDIFNFLPDGFLGPLIQVILIKISQRFLHSVDSTVSLFDFYVAQWDDYLFCSRCKQLSICRSVCAVSVFSKSLQSVPACILVCGLFLPLHLLSPHTPSSR